MHVSYRGGLKAARMTLTKRTGSLGINIFSFLLTELQQLRKFKNPQIEKLQHKIRSATSQTQKG